MDIIIQTSDPESINVEGIRSAIQALGYLVVGITVQDVS